MTTTWPPPSAATPLLILAFDHRASLVRDLYGLTGPPTPDQEARIKADKLLVYHGFLEALDAMPPGAEPGVLFDEQYGAGVAELARAESDRVRLAMPIEASGHDWFTFAYPDDWTGHVEAFQPDFIKLLIRDNPGLDPGSRQKQATQVAEVSRWARQEGRPLIIELLVPATGEDLQAVDGDRDRYDRDRRPALTVSVIENLQDAGVEPAIWKVEGQETTAAAELVAAVARRDQRTADLIVLGRNAPHDRLDHWLAVAAPVTGFVGFAIGRSIWFPPLHSHLHHGATAADVRRRVRRATSNMPGGIPGPEMAISPLPPIRPRPDDYPAG